LRLSKQTSDAVKILVWCARNDGGLIKVAEIAERTHVTKALGLKLVNLLSRLGYLETVRGPRGGIRLACVPEATRLGDIVRDLETFEMAPSASGMHAADGTLNLPPALEGCVDDAFEAFVGVLNQNTLADLAATGPGASLVAEQPAARPKPAGRRRTPRAQGTVATAQDDGAPT
jgi:Rrf2 family nitric oxide-sensitive transcriptional repressor